MDRLRIADAIQAMTKKFEKSWCLGDLVVQNTFNQKTSGASGASGANVP
jgi:hypothetical protein